MTPQEELQDKIMKALAYVIEPDLKKDIVALGLVSNVRVQGQTISFDVQVTTPPCTAASAWKKRAFTR